MTVVVCLKWLSPHDGDDRFGGISPADSSALEWALRSAATGSGTDDVVAVTVGSPAADAALRTALACGATRAVRIDVADPNDLSGADTAALIAGAVAGEDNVRFVWCGDYSLDRGTGSVPAFLAAHLDAGQALGLIELEVASEGTDTTILVTRRLDGGRRERLRVTAPAVLSVEGSTATLRRAPLAKSLSAQTAPIEVVSADHLLAGSHTPVVRRAFRPRARVLPPPSGEPLDRVKSLLSGPTAAKSHGAPVALSPADAADRILVSLREWGYLEHTGDQPGAADAS